MTKSKLSLKSNEFPKRYLVTSYKHSNYVKDKYKNRYIEISHWCPNDDIYYVDAKGRLKRLDMSDKSIWCPIYDDDGWPTLYQRKVRDGKK